MSSSVDGPATLTAADIKLIYKGKVLNDDHQDVMELLLAKNSTSSRSSSLSATEKLQKTYRFMATGLSPAEAARANQEFEQQQKMAPRVRDNLSAAGVKETLERQRRAQLLMQQAAAKQRDNKNSNNKYGFGRIETLPGLPEEQRAREILESLASDPGIKACMAKHEWHVGALAELYPDGKVGESAVCIMGLNENKGQRIKLRLRTDDLKGFRKILNIRKVLYHELAHNVHSEHNGDFFVLMRQIEKECNEMDWTQGAGLSLPLAVSQLPTFEGGTFRLGGGNSHGGVGGQQQDDETEPRRTHRELALQAALKRMTAEEHEIEQNCGCGRTDLFSPKVPPTTAGGDKSSASGSRHDSSGKDDDTMDTSP